jgi:hypothetical protein
MQMTSNPELRQHHTGTSASTNVPITDQTSTMNRKAPPAPSSPSPRASPPPPPPQHHHSHLISTDSSMSGMGGIDMSTNERETMKFNKRPGTVKLIPTTTPVTCVEDLQKILLPTKLNNLGKGSASASLLALSNSNSSASKMKSTGGTGYRPPTMKASSSRRSSDNLHRQNVTPCPADYVPNQQDVIISQQEHSHQHQAHQALPIFQRLLQQYATVYRERSTMVQRRKGALQVMRAVQAREGSFLCSYQQQGQKWAVVSNTTAERFIARLLEQVARSKQPAVSKMARAAQVADQHRAPMKSKSATATARAAVHVLLHRNPIAPPRPSIKLVNKETLKNKKLALTKAVATLTKPVLQQQQVKKAPAPPRQFQKKQRRSSSVMMKPPLARPPIETRPRSSYKDQQLKASAAALERYTNTTDDLDEPPRRVSWDKATIEAQRRAQQQVQMQHQGHQGQARKVSSVFNALDMLSSAAILDGGSSRSNSMSSDSGSSDSDSDEHSSEDSLSLLHAAATSVAPQQHQQKHQEQTGSLLKQRREQFRRLNSSSVVPVINNYDDADIKADLSYIWK